MSPIWLQNVAVHWIQASVLAGAAAVLVAVLRVRHPRVRLILWQTVFTVTLALPLLQQWEPLAVRTAPGAAPKRSPCPHGRG
jgi:hypothetical protein